MSLRPGRPRFNTMQGPFNRRELSYIFEDVESPPKPSSLYSAPSWTSAPSLSIEGDTDSEDDISEVITPEKALREPIDIELEFQKPAIRDEENEHLEQIVARYEQESKVLAHTAEASWRHYTKTKSEVERFEHLNAALKTFLKTCEDCHWQISNLDCAVEDLRDEVHAEAETMRRTVATLHERIPEAKHKLEGLRRKRQLVDDIVASAEMEVASMLSQLGMPVGDSRPVSRRSSVCD